ncbi:TetR/AcrR family transcriptional regulator [Nocardia sp. NPDC048505]|uniref:TetR/AcrR family transcriptional regulator n=1 Tax=unclassified Nocardia TaxID=2637762 RepID=UPI0033FCDED5
MPPSPRPHTGRRRNDAARRAILAAAIDLLGRAGGDVLHTTMDEIAAAAGVGKQTIYRWWPSKGAMLAEAMAEWARASAPDPDTGDAHADVAAFLAATFAASSTPPAAPLLRAILAEAQHDQQTAELLAAFARDRRATLRRILERGIDRGDLDAALDPEVLVDQAYGLLWYRLTISKEPLDAAVARRLAASLCR